MRPLYCALSALLLSTPLAAQPDSTPLLQLEARSTYRSWSTESCPRWSLLESTRFIDLHAVVLEETTRTLNCITQEGSRSTVRMTAWDPDAPGERPLWSFTQRGEDGRVVDDVPTRGWLYSVFVPGSGGAENAHVYYGLRDGSLRFVATAPLLWVPGTEMDEGWVAIHTPDSFVELPEAEDDPDVAAAVQFARVAGSVQRVVLRVDGGGSVMDEAEIVARNDGWVLRMRVDGYDVIEIPVSPDGLDWRGSTLPEGWSVTVQPGS